MGNSVDSGDDRSETNERNEEEKSNRVGRASVVNASQNNINRTTFMASSAHTKSIALKGSKAKHVADNSDSSGKSSQSLNSNTIR